MSEKAKRAELRRVFNAVSEAGDFPQLIIHVLRGIGVNIEEFARSLPALTHHSEPIVVSDEYKIEIKFASMWMNGRIYAGMERRERQVFYDMKNEWLDLVFSHMSN